MSWYIDVLKKYFVFSGRCSRKGYWMFILVNIILSVLCIIVDRLVFGLDLSAAVSLRALYSWAMFIPGTAAAIRRMHDIDRKGWWVLVPFYNIYLLCKKGDAETNRFGVPPAK